MDSGAGWRGRRANPKTFSVDPIRVGRHSRPEKQLQALRVASIDVASDQIRIRLLECDGVALASMQHHVFESGREALDLSFYRVGHVLSGPLRDVTIGPSQ